MSATKHAKRKAAGKCSDCGEPATHGTRCAEHAMKARRRTRLYGRADRVPTFEMFERMEADRGRE